MPISEPAAPRDEPVAAPAPVPPPRPLPEQVVFHAVSEHDAATEEAHRPVRRRKHDHTEVADQPPALQLVETQAPTAQVAPMEDDLPIRTKPRRRRGGPVADEPLKLVETQPGTEVRPDGQP